MARTAGARIVVIMVVAASVGDVLYRVLCTISHVPYASSTAIGYAEWLRGTSQSGCEPIAQRSDSACRMRKHVHWVAEAVCRLRLLLDLVPWGSRAVLAMRHSGLQAGSLAAAALVRACGPWVVLGPFRSRRRHRLEGLRSTRVSWWLRARAVKVRK